MSYLEPNLPTKIAWTTSLITPSTKQLKTPERWVLMVFPFEAGHSHAIFREQLNGWKPENGHKKHGLLQPAAHRWRPESAAALHPLLPAQVPDSSGSVSHILVDAQLLLKQFQDISSMGSMNGHITFEKHGATIHH